ncbi:hypothetical protein SteCoe_33211 [Stentor coeruleus]|uniref:F-box domain-containing protein n=1 Tax=Stentor coeruleus TaxID=5963 RepID=A0A1R2AXA1_9CILI|nr:hypothetical protein SteCoe_33211 [Stentor coeruleus]
MLSLFNRFISRMKSMHPVLGNRNLMVVILEYLDGEDLFQMYQVCFSFRNTIQSIPYIEITMLKYTMNESNKCIEKLKSVSSPPKPTYRPPMKTFHTAFPLMPMKRKSEPKPSQKFQQDDAMSQNDNEKWSNFVNYFHEYAKLKGFKVQKRENFSNEDDWKKYKRDFLGVYYSYVDHIREIRVKERANRFNLKNKLFNQYERLINNMNFKFNCYKQPMPAIKDEENKAIHQKETKFQMINCKWDNIYKFF